MHRATPASAWPATAFSWLRRWAGLSALPAAGLVRPRQPGQAAVEAALTAAISIVTILATLQLSLVAVQAYSASHVARSTARWLAVRMDTIDSDVAARATVIASDLPGMSGGGLASVTVSPSCAALVGGKCADRETGDAVTVTVTTSLAPIMFLPTSYGTPPFEFHLPTAMPPVEYTVLLE